MFQFPHLFPKFKSNEPVDMTQDVKEGITDVKPTMAQMRAAKKKGGIPPPQGRIGTLAVMKSGKVKMILGDGIVMDVSLILVSASQVLKRHTSLALTSRSLPVYRLHSYSSSFTSIPRLSRLSFWAKSTRISW